MRLEHRPRTRSVDRDSVPCDGAWELGGLLALSGAAAPPDPDGQRSRDDAAGFRNALALTVSIAGTPVEMIGLHVSSKVWRLAPVKHLLNLRGGLTANGPQILAGDFNFWGPGVGAAMHGWQRPVRGRTYPSHRPHSQIDHMLVRGGIEGLGGEVLPETPSDHRPIRTRLRLSEPGNNGGAG